MFPDSDICRQSLDALARRGFDRDSLQRTLRALVAAGLLSREPGRGHTANIYRLHLPPRSQP